MSNSYQVNLVLVSTAPTLLPKESKSSRNTMTTNNTSGALLLVALSPSLAILKDLLLVAVLKSDWS